MLVAFHKPMLPRQAEGIGRRQGRRISRPMGRQILLPGQGGFGGILVSHPATSFYGLVGRQEASYPTSSSRVCIWAHQNWTGMAAMGAKPLLAYTDE
jgi:hypothetical protein